MTTERGPVGPGTAELRERLCQQLDRLTGQMLAPIVVADELESGLFQEAAKLPGIFETFYAIVMQRRFAKTALTELLRV